MPNSLPQPTPNGDSLRYWQAARERRFMLRECKACGKKHFMPRHLCPHCWSDKLEWVESKGGGTVYSYSIVHRAPNPAFSANVPYVIAMIDLDDGPRMFANVLGANALDVAIGDRVKLTFEPRGEGAMLPQFERAIG